MKRLRWLLRVGINPERRHDLRYWIEDHRSGFEVIAVPEFTRRLKTRLMVALTKRYGDRA